MTQYRPVIALSLADALSTLGDDVGLIALLWLVMARTHSSMDMGILALFYGVPGLVSGPFAGILMDRWSRKWTVILANAAQGVLFLLMAGLSTASPLPVLLYILVLLAGFLIPPTAIGSFVMIAEHVKEDQLLRANALNEIFSKVPMVIGPAIGGWLITIGGIRIALLLDAASFFLAVLATLWVPHDQNPTARQDHAPSPLLLISQIVASLFFILKSRVVLLITLVALVMNGAYGVLEVTLPLLVHKQLHLSAMLLGTVWMAYAIGTVAGAFSNTVIHLPTTYGRILSGMVVGWGVIVVCTGLVSTPLGLLGGFALAGVSFGAYPPIARTVVQTSVPSAKRGQILSVRASIIGLGVPLGGFLAGAVNALVIPSTAIALTGAVIALVGMMILALLHATPPILPREERG